MDHDVNVIKCHSFNYACQLFAWGGGANIPSHSPAVVVQIPAIILSRESASQSEIIPSISLVLTILYLPGAGLMVNKGLFVLESILFCATRPTTVSLVPSLMPLKIVFEPLILMLFRVIVLLSSFRDCFTSGIL